MMLFAICLWLPITISCFSISFVCACNWWNILSWQSSLLQIQTLAMTHVFCLVPLKLRAYVNMLWIFCMSPPIPQIGPEALCFWVVLHFVCVCVCFHMYVHVWVLRHSPSGLILSKFAIWNKKNNEETGLMPFDVWCKPTNVFTLVLQCLLEGYYDADQHVICLHLQSVYDTVVMADLCRIAENDVSTNVCSHHWCLALL